MKLFKNLFLSILVVAALIAGNCHAMEKPKMRYQNPLYRRDSNDFVIHAFNNNDEVGHLSYQYLNDQVAEIILFEVNTGSRNDEKERIGQHLFQQCVDDVLLHGCNTLIWTVNPTGDLDLNTICMIYTKIVDKLTNSKHYTLIKGEEYGRYNPKADMELHFNIKCD